MRDIRGDSSLKLFTDCHDSVYETRLGKLGVSWQLQICHDIVWISQQTDYLPWHSLNESADILHKDILKIEDGSEER